MRPSTGFRQVPTQEIADGSVPGGQDVAEPPQQAQMALFALNGLMDRCSDYKDTAKRQGIRRHSTRTIQALGKYIRRKGRGTLLFAEYEGIRLATSLMLQAGHWATYKYGGQRGVLREMMAPYLLHFEAMKLAKSRGFRWYDFYGISPPDKPGDRMAGVTEFKRKFGGLELQFVPAMDFVYDQEAYRAYRRKPS